MCTLTCALPHNITKSSDQGVGATSLFSVSYRISDLRSAKVGECFCAAEKCLK